MVDHVMQAEMMQSSNNPPIEDAGSVCFILQRATGEIEIRGMTAERIWQEQLKYPEHAFGGMQQLNEAIWAVRGMKRAA